MIGIGIGIPERTPSVLGTSGPPPDPDPSRVVIDPSEGIGVDGHSFLAFPAGYMNDGGGSREFPDNWEGSINLTYQGFSTLLARWNLNGPSRTASYSGAGWVTEFADPSGGTWPRPDSTAGQETLQVLYWWAQLLQQKGCKALFIFPPHSPRDIPGTGLDLEIMRAHQYYADWLTARPDVTIPVYIFPVPRIIRVIRTVFGDAQVFSGDGLHLANSPEFDVVGAEGLGLKMMMTGEEELNDGSWTQGFQDMVTVIWGTIQEYACTGFGGSTIIEPTEVPADPLPNPTPLPGG